MTTMSKKELISATKARYLKSGKKNKGKILDEFCASAGYARKYAIADVLLLGIGVWVLATL